MQFLVLIILVFIIYNFDTFAYISTIIYVKKEGVENVTYEHRLISTSQNWNSMGNKEFNCVVESFVI